jgi:hypothetical protein
MAGCSVFTRPSMISGCPVTSDTRVTGSPRLEGPGRAPRGEELEAPVVQGLAEAPRVRSCRKR